MRNWRFFIMSKAAPEEIAQKLGLSTYTVTQIILTARNRGKL